MTTGNLAGIDLWLDEAARGTLALETNVVSGEVVRREALLERSPQPVRIGDAAASDTEALGQPHEIGIGEIGADQAIAVQALLHVANRCRRRRR